MTSPAPPAPADPAPATPSPPPRDRRQLLLEPGAALNGIDYVDVTAAQTRLFVHFINTVPVQGTLATTTPPVTITGGEVVTTVTVDPVDEATAWSADSAGRPVLSLTVPAPGDFSVYRLAIASAKLDPFFAAAGFTFKANCPATLDCAAPEPDCPPPADEQVPIDYLAKDFGSFKQALSEFSALRYPAWAERSEADIGMVLLEALSALADELSYYQDRVAAESALPTATQRLSVLRHARLVDYEPAPATTATALLQLDVAEAGTIGTPLRCGALGADSATVSFEVEDPAFGLAGPVSFTVDPRWNRGAMVPYYWDDSQRCLPRGSAACYLTGHGLGLGAQQQLLLDSPAADTADPPVRELVTVSQVTETADPLRGVDLTLVTLASATAADHDLYTTVVAGNIVPAVQGQRRTETFVIPDPALPPPGPVIVRAAANWAPGNALPDYRYCLGSGPLAWLAAAAGSAAGASAPAGAPDTPVPAQPEIAVTSTAPPTGATQAWTFARWLLQPDTAAIPLFTLTPEQYSPVLTGGGTTWYDYDGDGGTTIRFGDGTFGLVPEPGTAFTVTYRTSAGAAGNVPADTIVAVAPGQQQSALVTACTNPFPAVGGTDAETIAQVRARAPEQFRAEPLRVVLPADYVSAAQSLPWVQQAGTAFRWTGSWLSVRTSANPAGREVPEVGQLGSLTGLLNQRRLAGYESYVLPPRYASVDLRITVCGQASAFASDVAEAVLTRLRPGPLPGGGTGFFDHSRWRFGQALESSALLAAIQACPGVAGVYEVSYRQRGVQPDWVPLPETVPFADDEILRVDDDPSRPEAGSLQVTVAGAK
jgi:baseplate J-like protein